MVTSASIIACAKRKGNCHVKITHTVNCAIFNFHLGELVTTLIKTKEDLDTLSGKWKGF